jgi:dihydroorotate dehydrogenase (NAD+) catalytic subunit
MKRDNSTMKSNVSTTIACLKMDNPTMLAAGILGLTGASLKRVALRGAGAVVTKSISKEKEGGYPNPTVVEHIGGNAVLNAVGLSNPGCEEFAKEIPIAKEGGKPVIVSVYGSTPSEFVEASERMEKAGADALELNLSCPHSMPGIHVSPYFGQDEKKTYEVVEVVVNAVKIPVFAKLTPNVSSIGPIAKAAEEAGASAITAINTVGPCARIDINTACPIIGNTVGGLSGRAILPIAIRAIVDVKLEVDIPIIGVGGVTYPDDAIEMMLAGASAVQIGTAIMYKDLNIFDDITDGIRRYMKEHGYARLEDFVGKSLKIFENSRERTLRKTQMNAYHLSHTLKPTYA